MKDKKRWVPVGKLGCLLHQLHQLRVKRDGGQWRRPNSAQAAHCPRKDDSRREDAFGRETAFGEEEEIGRNLDLLLSSSTSKGRLSYPRRRESFLGRSRTGFPNLMLTREASLGFLVFPSFSLSFHSFWCFILLSKMNGWKVKKKKERKENPPPSGRGELVRQTSGLENLSFTSLTSLPSDTYTKG